MAIGMNLSQWRDEIEAEAATAPRVSGNGADPACGQGGQVRPGQG
jgi:hypothetical protein